MKNYKSTEEKFIFSPRMAKVQEDVLGRLQPNRPRENTDTSPAEIGERTPFVDEFTEHPDRPYIINLAKAIVRSWMVTPIMIFKDEALVGITRPLYTAREHFSWGIHADRIFGAEDLGLNDEEMRKLARRMEPMTLEYMDDEGRRIFGAEKYEILRKDHIFSAGGFQGHTVPDYPRLLEKGLDGMLAYIDACEAARAKGYVKIGTTGEGGEPLEGQELADFYEACRIIIRGMSEWLTAYGEEAAKLAATEADAVQKKYYEEISANCLFVAHNKPQTLYQALQLMWCLSLWDWVDCVGRSDQYLLPYYEKACKEGDVVCPEDAITSIIFKIWENGAHNVTLGGVHPEDGTDATNELSYLMLQVLRTIHDTHPRMSVRIHKDSPKEILELAVQMWAEGMSDPSVVGDENVIPGLVKIGVPIWDARDYSMLGCQEIEIPGKSNFGCEDGSFNVAKALEYALYNGRSTTCPDVQLGPVTGEFVDFENFEELFEAFATQLKFFTEVFVKLCDKGQEVRKANVAKLVKTPFTVGCLEKGKYHDMGGPLYNYGVVETAGVAAAADALTAIKKLVFEEKKITKERFMEAIRANYEGYEKERRMLLNMAPKFGNDDEQADAMAVRVLDLFWDECGKYKSVRGDVYTGACSLLEGGIKYGEDTGAIGDGRFGGEPLGNSIGPRPGADKCGVSAMLTSVAKLPLEKGMGGTTLNVVLTTRLLSNPELRKNIAATVRTYLLNGGQMAQVTTANVEELKDAQLHPERHGNLIVRIGGFSIQFVQLKESAQNEIISRY